MPDYEAVIGLETHIQLNTHSITRDGFEVSAHVVAIFSLGEPEEVLRLGYFGERPDDIRSLQVDEGRKLLRGSRDELEHADKLEVHRFYQHHTRFNGFDIETPPARDHQHRLFSPYHFDPQRVFQAVYADSRNPGNNTLESWLDLPVRVAVEAFHDLISLYHFSDLYQPKDAQRFPLNETFKPELFRRVRNQGVLSYQLVVRKDGQPFTVGQPWEPEQLTIFPVRSFKTSKILRDRGIRVIAATFPELKPSNPAVRQQLLDYWRAQWQRQRSAACPRRARRHPFHAT